MRPRNLFQFDLGVSAKYFETFVNHVLADGVLLGLDAYAQGSEDTGENGEV